MKKVLLALAVVALIGFASCSKSKTCVCHDVITHIEQPAFTIDEGQCSDYNTVIGGYVTIECVKK